MQTIQKIDNIDVDKGHLPRDNKGARFKAMVGYISFAMYFKIVSLNIP